MREFIQINRDWYFTGPDGSKTAVDLPHTWNAIDGQDGGNDYWRGTCLYEKDFAKPEFAADERIYLEFRGVNASAKIELNGTEIGTHDGGYSTFRWDITDHLADENHLKVWADNSRNDRVYPQKADFTFYGGIYRDVFLIRVNEKHFDMDHFGGPGIKVTARPTEGYTRGEVRVETYTNCEAGEVSVRILDADDKLVAQGSGTDAQMRIENARIWNGVKDPYLYTAQAVLTVDGREVDSVETRFGVRDFATDPKTGFYLNGKKYPLHGVSRHQDRKGIGNALTKEMHLEDMDMICEMGVNTVRLAHYQHDQYFYDLCDERGMVVWAEIPYISEHMPNGRENTISQMKELIIQNYNHPSIVCWGVSNESTISTKDNSVMLDNHRVLNGL